MDLLEDGIVPTDVRDIKADAREFAREQIEPNAAEYFESGEYPWEILEAGMDAGLVAGNLPPEYGGRDFGVHEMLAIAEEAMQLHGGRSVLGERRISRIYRDVRVPVIYEGANPIQRDLIYGQAPR